ncbi:MAG: 3-dehydroquinate synthase [Planctomycetaceae bacterium]|nr:MAG: 3-dehydroquinate synthase [Planctomycetaceae bacterium]
MSELEQPLFRFDTPLRESCPFFLGEGVSAQLPTHLRSHAPDRCFLVTSRTLFDLFGRQLAGVLRDSRIRTTVLLVEDGEVHKSWKALRRLGDRLVNAGATKDSILLAFGGGMIGNLVGLAAALLYRGTRFVEIPTTIMALTDSTLSNKQAINGRQGKNLFGVYHAPLFVWGDVRFARSEPVRQQRGGVVEGIKNILISGRCAGDAQPILDAWKTGDVPRLVRLLIDSKLPILRADPTERNSAVALEYGHTFGHAIEWLANGEVFHGEAVSIGMCLAAELCHSLGAMSDQFLEDHYDLLERKLSAPVRLPASLAPQAVLQVMHRDNKRSGKGLGYLLLADYGRFVNPEGDLQTRVDEELVLKVLDRARARGDAVGTL